MMHFPIPQIFWVGTIGAVLTLVLATLIGRLWTDVLPTRLRASASFYLAPTFGLATLTIVSSILGRHWALGTRGLAPAVAAILLLAALLRVIDRWQALKHALTVGVYGLVCGVALWEPLLSRGAISPHNDTFTYLAHSMWLQQHPFADRITSQNITALTTQIALYQGQGLRMGASYLCAFLQALFLQKWAFQIYPAVLIAAVTAACLSAGFALKRVLLGQRRSVRLMLLALPAFSFGGLVFGASLGFLPQIVGLTSAAGLIFMLGPLLSRAAMSKRAASELLWAGVLGAILFSSLAFAYSELLPFVTLAVALSLCYTAIRRDAWRQSFVLGMTLALVAALILNTELIRAYHALQGQSHAIVGSAVAWPLLGFAAHAIGIHGGAWDGFQWLSAPIVFRSHQFYLGVLLSCLTVFLLFRGIRPLGRILSRGDLLPALILLVVFAVAFLYFRYGVPSPFPIGVGNSWSEFKISDWANPVAVVFVVGAIASLRQRCRRFYERSILGIAAIGFVAAGTCGTIRVRPLAEYYGNAHDIDRFYRQFRDVVDTTCQPGQPVYLALDSGDQKFREMATLYLFDRTVKSDWTTDGYLYPTLPLALRTQDLTVGDCVVERTSVSSLMKQAHPIGPFDVGTFDENSSSLITATVGGYALEQSGSNWWRWVGRDITFDLRSYATADKTSQTRVHFGFVTRGPQNLTVRLFKSDQTKAAFVVHSDGQDDAFDKVINWPAAQLVRISIETDGVATPMSQTDSRLIAWQIRNLSVIPLFQAK